METQVFISFKYHDSNGNILPDYYMAKDLYERLEQEGIRVFFSDESIRAIAQSDYKRLIDKHLDSAKVLIVVSTSPENCNSNWVRYEWDSFYNDILSDNKEGEMISYLDTGDIRQFPRTIRTLQVFEKKQNGLNNAVMFVKQYFRINNTQKDVSWKTKGSSYNYNSSYELGDEKMRLKIQGRIESKKDIEYISQLLPNKEKKYNVLDVGCSAGSVTSDVFRHFKQSVQVLGVDKYSNCVSEFNDNTPSNMFAECLNFEDPEWESGLIRIMKNHNIDAFDLIYCSLSLHHMSDSEGVVRKLWKYLRNKGYIYIRTCDDGLKIAYPNEKPIQEIIQKTAMVPGASDRFHGRKVFPILYKSKYKNIRIESFLIDTSNKDLDERYALYYTAFVWRKNYFKNQLDLAKTADEINLAMTEYNKVIALLDEIENSFSNESFYFGYFVTIAIGQKSELWV